MGTVGKRKMARTIMALVALCCAAMAFIEVAVEPIYPIKSGIKVAIFLLFPLAAAKAARLRPFGRAFHLKGKDIAKLLALGALIYAVILGGYMLTQGIFDYGALVVSLSADQKVDSGSFWWIALYISFCNSFLEEFLFRSVSFLLLSQYAARGAAYAFSSVAFALYHVAMIGSSFPPPLLLLTLVGLAAGGCIFNYVDGKSETIYPSWVVHMFADLAIMTIWYLHI